MGSTETSMKKNMCTGIVAFYCLLYPEQTQYCKLEFLNNTRFCRNDLSNWKDERSALFCLQEPLVWLSIAPNVIITEGINYLSATSHNFQICFKIASSSMPVNKSVLGKKREQSRACVILPLLIGTCKNSSHWGTETGTGGSAGCTSVVGFMKGKISECLIRSTVISLCLLQETLKQRNKKKTN